ncbi:MAG: preprotein translocase subunit SecG, partial [Verrucomicrobiaceae bacterium]|nr:preprotein translocase subunit SecG [Verrucomicrobiaceae bacterium]NCF89629.1 preprotein translocase subunit SecG [Verrucomicrobiaceae bacterium]
MLGVITTILTVILVFICLLMSLVILMQRPKQEGLGAAFGGGIADKMLGSGTTDFLQRATVIMGVAFFVLSLTIATLMAYDRDADRKAGVSAVKAAANANAEPEAGAADGAGVSPIEPPVLDGVPPIEPPAVGAEVPAEEAEVPAEEAEVPAEEAEVPAEEAEVPA